MGRAAENIRVSQPLTVKELESNLVGNAKPEKTFEWGKTELRVILLYFIHGLL